MQEAGQCALQIMNLLQLGKIGKGADSMEGQYKSLQSRWYGVKKLPGEEKNSKIIDASEGKTFISRDRLVKIHVKVRNRVSIE